MANDALQENVHKLKCLQFSKHTNTFGIMILTNLSIVERTMLANQYHILAALSDDKYEADKFKKSAEIFENGYEGQYSEIFSKISDEIFPASDQKEVFDILDMFRKINKSLDRVELLEEERLNVKKLRFQGFDATNDNQYHFLYWWDSKNPNSSYVADLGDIAGYNSHDHSTLYTYRNMLAVYENFDFRGAPRLLTRQELQALSNA